MSPALASFHPLIQAWFSEELGEPTAPQVRGWPLIGQGRDVLIAAPTGSGKTLAAFLSCVDELLRRGLSGQLTEETRVVYVSPLKALGNDVQKNLLDPLEKLRLRAAQAGLVWPDLRVMVRSGDTPASERAAMVKKPPHILITTPESLFLYLTADRSRATLTGVRTVVVDEIHALARDKRGSHFALSLERLQALITRARPGDDELQRIGLSATTRPLELIGQFLTGAPRARRAPLELVEIGHQRPWELNIEIPEDELTAVPTHEQWGQLYDRLVELSRAHRTMLVFTNTRKLAERITHDLGERLGREAVAAHHGSISREIRLAAEDRLKRGELKVMVATASLELGIDIGSIDLMAQVGSPRSIAVMLQRLGRSGHHKSLVSKGVLFALSRDELVECVALLSAIRAGRLDAVRLPVAPLDVLAQQLVAEVASRGDVPTSEEELFDLVRLAMPYRGLRRPEFDQVLELVSDGIATSRGRSRVHLHRDRVNGLLRPRRGARLMALQNAGTIPDVFAYPVVAEPEDATVGTVDEDFATESMPGEIFVLGSTSWRIRRIFGGEVRVENAHGQPPSIPFWRGEAPARTDELSSEVARVREAALHTTAALDTNLGLSDSVSTALNRYLRAGVAALGAMPSLTTVVAERFFDDAGGMQLILHAPFGARINRAWGLALRKSFCRTFDFELQAAASDDGILLSLGEQHSFPLADIFDFVSPANAPRVLTQAVLQGPMFGTRFRWAAGRSLVLSRLQNGKRVPPPIQRARAEDLIAAVFPEQVGCQDNHGGEELELPDHPLVAETMKDCLHDFMDVEGLVAVLTGLKTGAIRKVAVDLPEPSVFAHAMLNSAVYTFLDDAPLEERRARAVAVRRTLPAEDAAAFGTLDAAAIEAVVGDAAPVIRNAEELHDALLQLAIAPLTHLGELPAVEIWLQQLAVQGRAATVVRGGRCYAFAAERVPVVRAAFAEQVLPLNPLPGDGPLERSAAVRQVVRGWMETVGPVCGVELAELLSLERAAVEEGLARLESVGQVVRGVFRPRREGGPSEVEWCDRRLLQRIHRLTVGRLRKEIEPLSAQDFMRFLFSWHQLGSGRQRRGPKALSQVVALLQGFEAPAAAWEQELFPARMRHYSPEWLEAACWAGEVAWGRLTLREPRDLGPRRGLEVGEVSRRASIPGRSASLTFTRRVDLEKLLAAARPGEDLADGPRPWPTDLSHPAKDVLAVLERRGASFFTELQSAARRLPTEVEDALWELLSRGLVTADAVQNLRVLQSPKLRRRQRAEQRGGPGRWSLLQPHERPEPDSVEEALAWLFLHRYGVVFRDLVAREPLAPAWRTLAQRYRRLEARGEIRGGRFLAGFAGEQYALPAAVETARAVRRAPKTGETIRISAVDPLNLTGIVTPGPRVPSILGQYVVYLDGVPTADGASPSLATPSGPR